MSCLQVASVVAQSALWLSWVKTLNLTEDMFRHDKVLCYVFLFPGLPTIFHIFSHAIPSEERSRSFGILVAFGSIGLTTASVVCIHVVSLSKIIDR